jgi:hypothetical protein
MWEKYLHGRDLTAATRLIDLPLQRAEDRRLSLLLASFDRLLSRRDHLSSKGRSTSSIYIV